MTKKRVLIVDDNIDLRTLVQMTLEYNDYEIHQAEDASQAMQLVKTVKPDIIILDIMMPGELDGIELCRIIKSSEETSATRVILLSAMGQKDDIARGIKAGADVYLTKPFSPLELIEKLKYIP